MTQNKGIQTEPIGGRWEGGKRGKRPKFETTKALHRHPFTLSGLPLDILALLGTVFLFLVGFIVITSYMAAGLGEGWLLGSSALLVAVGIPVALAVWAVRPMSGRRAFHWWLAVFAAPFLLASVGLSLAVPQRTARMVRWHGPWPARLLFGSESSQAQGLETVTDQLSVILSGFKTTPQNKKNDDGKNDQIHPPEVTQLANMGRTWYRPSATSLPEDLGRDRRHETNLVKKQGAWLVRAKFGPHGRQAILLLDPRATRTILSQEAATRLGISVLAQAPSVPTGLPNDDRKHPVVVVPWLSVGSARVSQIAVALCSSCVHEGMSGRLGANFFAHFRASIDSRNSRLRLVPKHVTGRPEDVDPFVVVVLDAKHRSDDHLTLTITLSTLKPVSKLRIEALLQDGQDRVAGVLSKTIERLDPGRPQKVEISGSIPEAAESFALRVSKGSWATRRPLRNHHHRRRRRHHGVRPTPSTTR